MSGLRLAVSPAARYTVRAMARVNENFLKLKAGYLFPEIARRVRVFTEEEPGKAKKLIRCLSPRAPR